MAEPSTKPPATLSGEILAERYQILREIGSGSMGAVYEARHTVLGRRLAVKVLKTDCSNPRLKERFFNEARAAGAITHQHIVQVYDFGLVPSGEPYIVMEYVDGETLQDYMDRLGALVPDDAVEIICQVLSTLDVIHHAGLVHRDIKPSNIMLVKARRPRLFTKLLDFGIAKAVNEDWDWPTLTRVDEVLGTPVYLSPEQAMGGKADQRWDLWAVGIMMYELLAGRLPFPTTSLIQITEDIVNFNLAPLARHKPDLSPWLLAIQKRALHTSMKLRFQTAAGFLHALEEKVAGGVGDTVPDEHDAPTTVDCEAVIQDDQIQQEEVEDPTLKETMPQDADQAAGQPAADDYSELFADMDLPDDNSKTIPMERPPQFQNQQQAAADTEPGAPPEPPGALEPAPPPAPSPPPAPASAPLSSEPTAQVNPMAFTDTRPGQQSPTEALEASLKPKWPIYVAIFGVFFVAALVLGVVFFLFR